MSHPAVLFKNPSLGAELSQADMMGCVFWTCGAGLDHFWLATPREPFQRSLRDLRRIVHAYESEA